MSIIKHRSYKDLVSLEQFPVKQGTMATIVFPNTLSNEYIDEINKSPNKLKLGCGCTSYSIQKELNQISFIVTAPSFNEILTAPYLKSVMPVFKSELGDEIHWDIKFYVI